MAVAHAQIAEYLKKELTEEAARLRVSEGYIIREALDRLLFPGLKRKNGYRRPKA